jgi:hypothetical protein
MQFSMRTLRTIATRVSGLKQDAARRRERAGEAHRRAGASVVTPTPHLERAGRRDLQRLVAFVPRRHFATLPGVAPIPASSGQVVRHRLNRSGDRRLNRALRPLVTACDPEMDVALPCYRSGEVDPIIPDEGNEVACRPPVT